MMPHPQRRDFSSKRRRPCCNSALAGTRTGGDTVRSLRAAKRQWKAKKLGPKDCHLVYCAQRSLSVLPVGVAQARDGAASTASQPRQTVTMLPLPEARRLLHNYRIDKAVCSRLRSARLNVHSAAAHGRPCKIVETRRSCSTTILRVVTSEPAVQPKGSRCEAWPRPGC